LRSGTTILIHYQRHRLFFRKIINHQICFSTRIRISSHPQRVTESSPWDNTFCILSLYTFFADDNSVRTHKYWILTQFQSKTASVRKGLTKPARVAGFRLHVYLNYFTHIIVNSNSFCAFQVAPDSLSPNGTLFISEPSSGIKVPKTGGSSFHSQRVTSNEYQHYLTNASYSI
jgi:hypothetical protein